MGAIVDMDTDLPRVKGNSDELYVVFQNIIGNALKYHGREPLRISIGCEDEGGRAWRIRVKDNGIGIEPGQGYEERIFGLFQRLHQRDEYGGGTGAGLPICRKIINRHGGRVWAESEGIGKGSTFVVRLPKC